MGRETWKRRTQRHLIFARACGIKAWIPAKPQIDAAQERTEGMVSLYMHHGAKAEDLPVLVRSAYLQGVWDAGCAMAMMDGLKPRTESL